MEERTRMANQWMLFNLLNYLNQSYFHGHGITPFGFFTPLNIIDNSQLLGFLEAWLSFEVVIS